MSTALSGINAANEPRYETAADWCEISSPPPQEMAKSVEEEEVIYSTPCEDEGNYGPIYFEPPCDEHKIYAEFEGKRFRKLYHKEIWLDTIVKLHAFCYLNVTVLYILSILAMYV